MESQTSANPLLADSPLPLFDQITPAHAVPAIEVCISAYQAVARRVADDDSKPTWETVMEPLEAADRDLANAFSPVSHLSSVMDSPEWRKAYGEALQKITEFETWLHQHEGLYHRYRALKDNEAAYQALTEPQQAALDQALLDAELSGIALPPAKRERYGVLAGELSALSQTFSEHLLDATQGWTLPVDDAEKLAGLPEDAMTTLRQNARQEGKSGWLITLDIPSYLPVMTYCQNRELRRQVHEAFSTRASDAGPNAGQWDNSPVMADIMQRRREAAELLGYANPAEVSLATKMADSPGQVREFLQDLAARALPQARQDVAELSEFAASELGLSPLEPWDIAFASEQLKQARYQVSDEAMKPWFPLPRVLSGLFETVYRLYGITLEPVSQGAVYHSDVQLYQLKEGSQTLAYCYLDLYARKGKRGGAWMDDARVRRRVGEQLQLPVAYLCCNFTPPVDGQPSLLTHDDVTTLFHEFGHGLHHMLTEVDVGAVSGINGVAWDAVELPSQFMENFCWDPEALAFISGHVDTGEPIPTELLDKMLAARNFQAAMQMVRQIEFSLFDLDLHECYQGGGADEIRGYLDRVRDAVTVIPVAPYQRFENSFAHIFAGGYAAGYYSYKWAEVLSADAYSRFEDEGTFSSQAARDFRQHILARGGSRPVAELYALFRGRSASNDALLRHNGIRGAQSAVGG